MRTDSDTSPFLSVAEAALRLHVSRATAYNLVRAGVVPAVRLNGVLRIPRGALECWLLRCEQEALDGVLGDKGRAG